MGTEHSQKDRAGSTGSAGGGGATTTAPTLIGSVQRALRLVEAMYAEGGATAKRLSRLTGIPLPTVYHLLRTLSHEGYVQREGGAFRLSDDLPLAS
ncbi:helix-turn-helix domain-containing protein [Streptomyces sp. NPDC058289]|uniref:helix-turn-helix domain-containing protein n=1 Tax=Streptomyces sp. NPDC058289 TaxID=3346425 RepID=UPI0036E1BC6C